MPSNMEKYKQKSRQNRESVTKIMLLKNWEQDSSIRVMMLACPFCKGCGKGNTEQIHMYFKNMYLDQMRDKMNHST